MRRIVRVAAFAFVGVASAAAGADQQAPTTSGQALFAANCSNCHGRYGEGGGPAGVDLPRTPPDLRRLAARNGGVFPRDRVAEIIDGRATVAAHADRSMPVWGDAFAKLDPDAKSPSEAQARAKAKIDALVDFLASIQQP